MQVRGRSIADLAALVAIAGAVGFLVLAAVVNGQGRVGFDEPIAALFTGLGVPAGAWRTITELGGLVLVPIGVGLVIALLSLRQYRLAVLVAVVLVGSALFTDHVKDFVARPRPPGDPLAPARGSSFPSGHTLESSVTYGLVALAAWRSRMRRGIRRAIVAAAIAIPVLVGLSRIGLGVHYPSDVLGGWLVGVTAVAATAWISAPWAVATTPWAVPRATEAADAPPHAGPGPIAPRHVVLLGLMGTGKTTIGHLLAAELGRPFRDSDADIEHRLGLTARELRDRDGTDALHALEARHLLDALADPVPAVIGAAASAIVDDACRAALRGPEVLAVWLRGDPAVLADRFPADGHRPAYGDEPAAFLAEQAAHRDPLFAEVAPLVVDLDDGSAEDVARRILAAIDGPR